MASSVLWIEPNGNHVLLGDGSMRTRAGRVITFDETEAMIELHGLHRFQPAHDYGAHEEEKRVDDANEDVNYDHAEGEGGEEGEEKVEVDDEDEEKEEEEEEEAPVDLCSVCATYDEVIGRGSTAAVFARRKDDKAASDYVASGATVALAAKRFRRRTQFVAEVAALDAVRAALERRGGCDNGSDRFDRTSNGAAGRCRLLLPVQVCPACRVLFNERARGGDLDAWAAAAPAAARRRAAPGMVRALAVRLRALHVAGVVHGDFKGKNVLLDSPPRAAESRADETGVLNDGVDDDGPMLFIADFGCARVFRLDAFGGVDEAAAGAFSFSEALAASAVTASAVTASVTAEAVEAAAAAAAAAYAEAFRAGVADDAKKFATLALQLTLGLPYPAALAALCAGKFPRAAANGPAPFTVDEVLSFVGPAPDAAHAASPSDDPPCRKVAHVSRI
jgi:hypothetical protein